MNDKNSTINLKVGDKIYELNNNSNKLERAKKEAGENASNKRILAHYDKLAGLIKLEGIKLGNGEFWEREKKKIETKKKLIFGVNIVSDITRHPIIATIVIAALVLATYFLLGIDLRSFV